MCLLQFILQIISALWECRGLTDEALDTSPALTSGWSANAIRIGQGRGRQSPMIRLNLKSFRVFRQHNQPIVIALAMEDKSVVAYETGTAIDGWNLRRCMPL